MWPTRGATDGQSRIPEVTRELALRGLRSGETSASKFETSASPNETNTPCACVGAACRRCPSCPSPRCTDLFFNGIDRPGINKSRSLANCLDRRGMSFPLPLLLHYTLTSLSPPIPSRVSHKMSPSIAHFWTWSLHMIRPLRVADLCHCGGWEGGTSILIWSSVRPFHLSSCLLLLSPLLVAACLPCLTPR